MIKTDNLRQKSIHKEYIEFSIDGTSFMLPKVFSYRYSYREGFDNIRIFQVLQHREIPDILGCRILESVVSNINNEDKKDLFDYYHNNIKRIVDVDYICHADLLILRNCTNPNNDLLFFPDDRRDIFITPYSTLDRLNSFEECDLYYLADRIKNDLIVNTISRDNEAREYLLGQLKYYLSHSPNSKRKDDEWLDFDSRWR